MDKLVGQERLARAVTLTDVGKRAINRRNRALEIFRDFRLPLPVDVAGIGDQRVGTGFSPR
jgi:hypothetical protein